MTNPVSPRPEFKPRYFPELSSGQTPNITNELVETIAFILAGVDPAQRRDSNALRSRMTLRQLVHVRRRKCRPMRHSVVNIAIYWFICGSYLNRSSMMPGRTLRVRRKDKTIRTRSSCCSGLKNLNSTTRVSRSLLAVNGELFQQIREKSVDMLVRIVRRARRTITSYHEEVQQPPRQSILQRLGLFRASASSTPLDVVPIEPVVLKSAEEYVLPCNQASRILRIDSRKPTSGLKSLSVTMD